MREKNNIPIVNSEEDLQEKLGFLLNIRFSKYVLGERRPDENKAIADTNALNYARHYGCIVVHAVPSKRDGKDIFKYIGYKRRFSIS